MSSNCICSVHCKSTSITTSNSLSSLPIPSSSFLKIRKFTKFNSIKNGNFTRTNRRRKGVIVCGLLPIDPWAPNIDTQSIASQLFAFSLFPYLGFLYFITKSKSAPKLTLFGFYFLLAFVGATSLVKRLSESRMCSKLGAGKHMAMHRSHVFDDGKSRG
ncbi:Solute carrier family 12 member 3 [Bienertia sinuspersici]